MTLLRTSRRARCLVPALAFLAVPLAAQTVLPPFNAAWHVRDLGPIAGPASYGGIAFLHNDPNVLLFGGYGSGQILAVPLVRGPGGQITGFGAATNHASVTGPDGGLAYGPSNVLFHTAWPQNIVGQIPPGSTSASAVVQLAPLGVPNSVGACAFPAAGAPGSGRLKLATYSGWWCDAAIAPDGSGTYAITAVAAPIQLGGGPEGILYPPPNALVPGQSVLIVEWNTGRITLYATDANGDPVPGTDQTVVAGLTYPGGGALDPVSGDLLFTHDAGHLVALRLGGRCGVATTYGQGGPGLNGVPAIGSLGCARIGSQFGVTIGSGRPGAFGSMAVGFQQASVPVLNFFLLNDGAVAIAHSLDASGAYTLTVPVPGLPIYGNFDVFFQAGYLDAAAPFGVSATPGLQVHIE
jgi:hypothetical protein